MEVHVVKLFPSINSEVKPVTVPVTFDGEKYIVHRFWFLQAYTSGTSIFKVNGNMIDPNQIITVTELPVIEEWTKIEKVVRYESVIEGDPELSSDEYTTKIQKLLSKRIYVDETESYRYKTIEDEIEYTRLAKNYKPIKIYDLRFEREIPVIVYEKVPDDIPFVIPARHCGGPIASRYAVYNQSAHINTLVRERLSKYKFTEKQMWANEKKMSYNFFFNERGHYTEISLYLGGRKVLDLKVTQIADDFDKIIELKEKRENEINDIFENYMNSLRQLPDAYEILKRIGQMQSLVFGIPSNKKTESDLRVLRNILMETKDLIETTMKESIKETIE